MLRRSVVRQFVSKKLLRAADVEADPSLKTYFDTRLQAWTLQYLATEQHRKNLLAKSIPPERRTKIEMLSRLIAFLPPEERWLVTEYIENASLQEFLIRESPTDVSKDFSSLNGCKPF